MSLGLQRVGHDSDFTSLGEERVEHGGSLGHETPLCDIIMVDMCCYMFVQTLKMGQE